MFKYERAILKKASRATWGAMARFTDFVNRQVTDPAVRRAILLGFAAYLIRHAPFLDQDTAEKLGDEAMVLFGIMLSKMRGTAELRAQSRAQVVQADHS